MEDLAELFFFHSDFSLTPVSNHRIIKNCTTFTWMQILFYSVLFVKKTRFTNAGFLSTIKSAHDVIQHLMKNKLDRNLIGSGGEPGT